MKYLLCFLSLLYAPVQGFCVEKLRSDYLVTFGHPEASIQVVQYFSFTCPHCLSLFRKDFQALKATYLDTKKIAWIFHPVPMDLLTVQAMACLEKLSEKEKRIFLEALLEMIPLDDAALSVCYMQKAMELFDKPLPELQEKTYLSHTQAFKEAFLFLKQKEKIEVVPIVEINGLLFPNEVPDQAFIEQKLKPLLHQSLLVEESP